MEKDGGRGSTGNDEQEGMKEVVEEEMRYLPIAGSQGQCGQGPED